MDQVSRHLIYNKCMNKADSFDSLGLAPKLLDALVRLGFRTPTPIQLKAIPAAVEGEDIIGIAQTGTGKTLGFGLPMIQRVARLKRRGLVVLPTRELAIQVDEELKKIAGPLGLRTAILIGGENIKAQIRQIKKHPHIIVGTPGRIIDHLDQKILSLKDVGILVLDEADRMLDMGFLPQISKIIASVPKERQTMLFSATMPNDIVRIADRHMKKPVRVEVAPAGTVAQNVDQELFIVDRKDKLRLLEKLLKDYAGTVLVFTRTKHAAKKVKSVVEKMGHAAAEIHSNRSQAQRKAALQGFKSGKYRILVATDIAARGLDVSNIELVVNYDVPAHPDDYVHRIGRTGRAGLSGKAITFGTPDEGKEVRAIEKYAGVYLPDSPLPELPAPSDSNRFSHKVRDRNFGKGRGGTRRSSGDTRTRSGDTRTRTSSSSRKTHVGRSPARGSKGSKPSRTSNVLSVSRKAPRKDAPMNPNIDPNITAALGDLWPNADKK